VTQLTFRDVSAGAPNRLVFRDIFGFGGSGPSIVTEPGPPTGVVASVVSSGVMSVTFVPPLNNGGSPVTGYTVTSIPAGGVDINAGQPTLTHTITGLTNGVSYTFTVVATNIIGDSVPSAPSSAVVASPAVSGVLVDADNVPRANLSALKWALIAGITPDVFGAVVAQGAAASTNASGAYFIPVLTATGVYWFTITDSDGVPGPHNAFSGPKAVV
jgi:hypothetical protein